MGLLGPNGAGKSTTIQMLVGLVHPTRGDAWIEGHHVQEEGVQARQHLGYLPEVVGLYDELTAEAYLRYVARFHGVRGPAATNRIETLLAEVRLTHAADRPIGTFSKGMRQRVALAGALLHDPSVLVLDEPLSGLDPEGIVKMKHAIEQLGRERTVLVCSHELHAVESLCDRALVLREGNLLADAPVQKLTQRHPPRFRIRTAKALASIQDVSAVKGVIAADRGEQDAEIVLELAGEAAASRVVAHLVQAGHQVRGVQKDERTLEEAFIELTGVRT